MMESEIEVQYKRLGVPAAFPANLLELPDTDLTDLLAELLNGLGVSRGTEK